MAISLYDGSVTSYLQILDAVQGYLDKGLTHCQVNDIDPTEIVESRIFPDMLPFRFQVQSVAFHSLGAIEAIKSGVVGMPGPRPAHDYAGLQGLIADAREALRRVTPEEIEAREGADVVFEARGLRRVFTAEGFLTSFSLPNFHFHATTAYNILRSKGVPVGKFDYVGALRLKP
ncbi:MAG TPA: DUF1993 domain-containing protein [Aliidongia sp.]|uniref:DUF1993 domain-containing protein n=1 Tax=Aliidongia sp. TaxID=1914230 RepID=UPI002DDCB6EB|nr:DUF1993 domain-containing protein [Aliidongia sp.]HEV2677493.1 DUF1993 domain-containing protein [Aliidongia sp.]